LVAPHTYIYVLRAHPVRGESHNQRNTTGEVATVALKRWIFEKTEMCKKNIYLLCNVKRLEQDIKSR